MKTYLEFINESISFTRLRKEFKKKFPTKEIYEQYIIDKANEYYQDYEVEDIQDIDEGAYDAIIEKDLIWEFLDDYDELPEQEILRLHEKIVDLINEFYSDSIGFPS